MTNNFETRKYSDRWDSSIGLYSPNIPFERLGHADAREHRSQDVGLELDTYLDQLPVQTNFPRSSVLVELKLIFCERRAVNRIKSRLSASGRR